jgi:hypothetical protein
MDFVGAVKPAIEDVEVRNFLAFCLTLDQPNRSSYTFKESKKALVSEKLSLLFL